MSLLLDLLISYCKCLEMCQSSGVKLNTEEGGDHHKEKSLEISSKSPPFLLQ